jgi:CRP-like cAMP-binding protein
VKVSAPTLEGGERLLNIYWPGDFFGMIWLSRDQRRVSIAQALSPVTVQTTTNGGLTEFLRLRPDLYSELVQNLFDQQGRITLRMVNYTDIEPIIQISAVEILR